MWLPFTVEQVYACALDGCQNTVIAALCNCSVDTLERRFGEELRLARAWRQWDIAKRQTAVAQSGDRNGMTMLIFLGKNELGQADNPPPSTELPPSAEDHAHRVRAQLDQMDAVTVVAPAQPGEVE